MRIASLENELEDLRAMTVAAPPPERGSYPPPNRTAVRWFFGWFIFAVVGGALLRVSGAGGVLGFFGVAGMTFAALLV